MRYIKRVYIWESGMVMVFDQFGEQMPDYQGHKSEVWERIHRDAPVDAEIFDNMNWEKEKHRFFPPTGEASK